MKFVALGSFETVRKLEPVFSPQTVVTCKKEFLVVGSVFRKHVSRECFC